MEYGFGGEWFDVGGWGSAEYKVKKIPKKGEGKIVERKRGAIVGDGSAGAVAAAVAAAQAQNGATAGSNGGPPGAGAPPHVQRGSTSVPARRSTTGSSTGSQPDPSETNPAGIMSIRLVSTAMFSGVAGYIYYTGTDGSCLEIAFQSPLVGADRLCCRRYDTFSGNAAKLYEQCPEVVPPGYRVRTKQNNLGWITTSNVSGDLRVRVIIPNMKGSKEELEKDAVYSMIASSSLCASYQAAAAGTTTATVARTMAVEVWAVFWENSGGEKSRGDLSFVVGGELASDKGNEGDEQLLRAGVPVLLSCGPVVLGTMKNRHLRWYPRQPSLSCVL